MKLRTAEREYEVKGAHRGAEAVLNTWTSVGQVPPKVPRGSSIAVHVEAIVRANHGRWIVDCPFCTSAQIASESDHRFFCPDCGNAEVGGQWVATVWPSPAEIDAVETALMRRPTENRNWDRSEGIEVLEGENVSHGLDNT